MDLKAPRARIALCVEEIEGIANLDTDSIRQLIADAVASCFRDLERYSHETSGFCMDLRTALADRSQAMAGTNPKLSLVFERAIDCVWTKDQKSLRPPSISF